MIRTTQRLDTTSVSALARVDVHEAPTTAPGFWILTTKPYGTRQPPGAHPR
ncbi:MAG: hypothetical protein ACE5GB_14360 [Acidimicrobiales bacterium]